ncbi:MAG: exodeoxyribonuclease VII large subunit, partial [Halobacteria archaeon]
MFESILSIIELNLYVKTLLNSQEHLKDLWVRGEVSNFTQHSSGHCYFTLKDESS